jgi:hypothetical protein
VTWAGNSAGAKDSPLAAPAGDRHLSGRWLGTRRVGIAPTAVRESMASMLRAHWRLGSRVMTEVFIPDDELARKAGAPVPGAIELACA